jgi:UDP-glucose 4-epimerase
MRILNAQNEIQIIGTRHGEKLYETLLNREEMAQAEDRGDYFCVAADARDLNYACYFTEGKATVSTAPDYNSHNTDLLGVDAMIDTLLKLECVQDALNGIPTPA